ncbi:hypothetical protein pipiens_012882 [Culex pipiens pipiens]|uniref:Uncharacterized protein n=1 Tax=Culex pipiens pipiens TaxID=38569 RepID=A0ABD1D0K8_CULPP
MGGMSELSLEFIVDSHLLESVLARLADGLAGGINDIGGNRYRQATLKSGQVYTDHVGLGVLHLIIISATQFPDP